MYIHAQTLCPIKNNNNDQSIYSAVNDIDRTKSETQGRRAAEGAQREATANKSAIKIV